jgi:hypothetical protein
MMQAARRWWSTRNLSSGPLLSGVDSGVQEKVLLVGNTTPMGASPFSHNATNGSNSSYSGVRKLGDFQIPIVNKQIDDIGNLSEYRELYNV